jgi:hypothetical protein
LPISLGVEYGLNMKWEFGNKTKVEEETSIDGDVNSAEYLMSYDWPSDVRFYTMPYQAPTQYYDKLKNNYFGMESNQNVRIVLNIYFGN